MKTPRALLLYEETNSSELLWHVLADEGCQVEEAPLDAHLTPATDGYCIVVFDIQRLTTHLLEFIRTWGDGVSDTTLLVIGSRTTQTNRIALLETGIAAYLSKPVAVPELRARVHAAFQRFRSHHLRPRQFSFGTGVIDLEARMIRASGHDTRLTPTECNILEHLAQHLNQTVSSADLVKTLWGDDPQKGVHSLRLFIRKLRNKLEPDPGRPQFLVTEPAIGYRLQIPREIVRKSVDA
jgi:two-component system KDP operon response regulator KdpE